jgi:hypothetical protein
MSRLPVTRPCERCGRAVTVNTARPQPPVRCCPDCRSADPEYLRLRTSKTLVDSRFHAGIGSRQQVESQVPRPALATPNGAAPSTTARRLDGTL